jgi:hypothetical protein
MSAEDRRLAAVRRSITAALESVASDVAAVTAALEAARDCAGSALGTEDGSFFEREPADERALGEAEARMRRARGRLAQLTELRNRLFDLRSLLDETGGPEPRPSRSVHQSPMISSDPAQQAMAGAGQMS